MKKHLLTIITLIGICNSQVKSQIKNDSTKLNYASLDIMPSYPGGFDQFSKYIAENLTYPEIAKLTGVNGKVILEFVVEKDGSIVEIKPLSCVGAGCEAEAVRILSNSKKWNPGILKNRPVRVSFKLPIQFNAGKQFVLMTDLKKSDYGFVFEIDQKEYLLDEAAKILGTSFSSKLILLTVPYPDQGKYSIPNKKEIYLIKIRS